MIRADAFLQAIRESPDDDAPRLIYADWLEEHDEPERAEFVRVQIELARGARTAVAERRLQEREGRLLREHEVHWTAPLHGMVLRSRFRRGFPECVTLTAESFLTHADAVFRLAPIRHVILTQPEGHVKKLAGSPYLGEVQTLEFRTLARKDIATLVRSRHLERLAGLILRYTYMNDKDAAVLAKAPALAGLTLLDLHGGDLGRDGALALVTSPHLSGLTDLVLGDHPQLGDGGAFALADRISRLDRLARLHLSFAGITDVGARALADSPFLPALRSLDLGFNAISAAGARALADSPHLQGLTHLGLRGNPLGRRARETLAERLLDRVQL